MSTIVYDAFPVLGGTSSMTRLNSSCIHLTGAYYVTIFVQTAPVKIVAGLVKINNPESDSPTVSLVRQQTLDSLDHTTAFSRIRAFKMSDSSFVLFTANGTSVLRSTMWSVDKETGIISNMNATVVGTMDLNMAYNDNTTGDALVKDNDLVFAIHNSNNNKRISSAIYKPDTNTLTLTPNLRSVAGVLNTTSAVNFSKIPNSDKTFFYVNSDDTNSLALPNTLGVYSDGVVEYYITGLGLGILGSFINAISDNEFIVTCGAVFRHVTVDPVSRELTRGQLRMIDGTTYRAPELPPVCLLPLTSDNKSYISVTCGSSGYNSAGANYYIRVVRHVDDVTAICSPSTASYTTAGMLVPAISGAFINQASKLLSRIHDSAACMVRGNATQFIFTVIRG